MGGRPSTIAGWAALALISLTLTAAASAQNLYLEGQFGGSNANADIDASVEGALRIDGSEDDSDRSIVGGGSMGFRFPLSWALDRPLPRHVPDVQFRLEGEVLAGREYDFFTTNGFRENQPDAEFRTNYDVTITGLTNIWFEVPVYRQWSLFAGVGVGAALIETDTRNAFGGIDGSKDDTVFAWQGGAGVEYRFDDQVSLGFGYRYMDLGSHEIDVDASNSAGDVNVDVVSHEFMLRLRVNFYYF